MKRMKLRHFLAAVLISAAAWNTANAQPNDYATQMNNFLGYCQSTGHQNPQCPHHGSSRAPTIWVTYVFNPKTGVGYGSAYQGGKIPRTRAKEAALDGCRKQPNGCVKGSFFRGIRSSRDEIIEFGGSANTPTVAVAMGYDAAKGIYRADSRYTEGIGDLSRLEYNALRDCRNNGLQDCRISYTFAR